MCVSCLYYSDSVIDLPHSHDKSGISQGGMHAPLATVHVHVHVQTTLVMYIPTFSSETPGLGHRQANRGDHRPARGLPVCQRQGPDGWGGA